MMQERLDLLLKKAYSPYSHVKVSAILITKDQKVFEGVNIENAAFSPTMCAERNAIFQAITQGYRKGDFLEINLSANTSNFISPCGVCRQVMAEFFEPDTKIILWHQGRKKVYCFADLLPLDFSAKDFK